MVLHSAFYSQGISSMALHKADYSGDLFMVLQDALFSREVCPRYSKEASTSNPIILSNWCSLSIVLPEKVLAILSSSPTGPAELEALGGKNTKGWLSYDRCQATKMITASTSWRLQFSTCKLTYYF